MIKFIILSAVFLILEGNSIAQQKPIDDSELQQASLKDCVQYALSHQPIIQQTYLDEEITDHAIKGKLADWLPQVDFNLNIIHNYQLPVSIVGGNPAKVGLLNTSAGQFYLSQTIFNRDVFLAASTAGDLRQLFRQRSALSRIDIVVAVSKSFYGVLLTRDEINVINEDIIRLEQSYKDTYNQYKSGVVDKTDYMRATIALNNANAEKRQFEEAIKGRIALLKELMGYQGNNDFKLQPDSTEMSSNTFIDTTLDVNYENRTEFRLLESQIRLQEANVRYNNLSFVPSLNAFGNYEFFFQNDKLSKLYNVNYPASNIGLQLSIPIFEGGKRIQEIEQASLELKRYSYDIVTIKDSINTEFTVALGDYKSNLNFYNTLKGNLDLAKEVYNTIQLQYRSGIKTYLDVITAETDLRTTQVNYTNALYQLLSSKLDLQKALGIVKY
jgi:outer membrane protein TolC